MVGRSGHQIAPDVGLHFTGFVLVAPQVLWSKIGIDVLHFDKVLDLF